MRKNSNKNGNFSDANEQLSINDRYSIANDLNETDTSYNSINDLIRRAENDKKIADFEASQHSDSPFVDNGLNNGAKTEDNKPKKKLKTKRINLFAKKPSTKEDVSVNEPKDDNLKPENNTSENNNYNEDTENILEDDSEASEKDKVPGNKKFVLFNNFQICVIGLVVFVLMLFFAENNNIIYKQNLTKRLEASIVERDSLLEQVRKDSTIIERIENDDKYLEKYAREHFYYRADDEDVFIVEPE